MSSSTLGRGAALLTLVGLASLVLSNASLPAQSPDQPKKIEEAAKVTAIPEAVREKYKLDPFYEKHIDYKGFSIMSSKKVSDEGLLEARYLIDQLLGEREDILKALIKQGCRFMVMAPTEMTTDVPEQSHWDKEYWDKRARGMGGKLSSCGEENLLNLKGDRYNKENILIHEFNHAIHQQGLRVVDPTFNGRLKAAYDRAKANGLWKGTYSMTNPAEYWAEAAQAYFDCMRPSYVPKVGDAKMKTREKLELYDPDLFKLVDEVYKQSKFRYVRYDKRFPKKAQDAKKGDLKKDDSKKNDAKKDGKLFPLDLPPLAFDGYSWRTSPLARSLKPGRR